MGRDELIEIALRSSFAALPLVYILNEIHPCKEEHPVLYALASFFVLNLSAANALYQYRNMEEQIAINKAEPILKEIKELKTPTSNKILELHTSLAQLKLPNEFQDKKFELIQKLQKINILQDRKTIRAMGKKTTPPDINPDCIMNNTVIVTIANTSASLIVN
jgi:hypothetical protein